MSQCSSLCYASPATCPFLCTYSQSSTVPQSSSWQVQGRHGRVNYYYPNLFTRRSIIFMFSSLSSIYFELFKYGCPHSLHLLSSEVCKPTLDPNFQYMARIIYFRYLFFALSPLKIFLSSSCVCMSLTDHKWVFSLGPPLLGCALYLNIPCLYYSIYKCLYICCHARPVFLYINILFYIEEILGTTICIKLCLSCIKLRRTN